MRFLLTSGATREPIDGVRFITNFSTGSTGAALADALLAEGHEVLYLAGEGARAPSRPCRRANFSSFQNLAQLLQRTLAEEPVEAIVHLAAVSDYSVQTVEAAGQAFVPGAVPKLDSETPLTLRLAPNPKLVRRLKDYARANPAAKTEPWVVAFKLTNTSDPAERDRAVRKLREGGGVDRVVHNDLEEIRAGKQVFTIFDREGSRLERCANVGELARFLVRDRKECV